MPANLSTGTSGTPPYRYDISVSLTPRESRSTQGLVLKTECTTILWATSLIEQHIAGFPNQNRNVSFLASRNFHIFTLPSHRYLMKIHDTSPRYTFEHTLKYFFETARILCSTSIVFRIRRGIMREIIA